MIIKDIKNRANQKDVTFIRGNVPVNYSDVMYNPIFRNLVQTDTVISSYDEIPEVRTIINYYASQVSKVKYNLYKKTTNKKKLIDSHPLLDLLNNPNDLLNFNELIMLYISYLKLTGNAYLNAFAPVGFQPEKLYVLPSQYIKIHSTDTKDFRLNEVTKYELYTGQYDIYFEPDYVLHKKEVNLRFDNEQYFLGQSPLFSTNKVLSSLEAIYEAKVSIYQKRGALGILTFNATGSVADFVAPRPDEIKDLQEKYSQYGLSRNQYQLIVSQSPLKWERMSMDMQELQLTENQKADRETICNIYNIPAIIFTNEGTTFANKKEANIQTWEAELMPFTINLYNDLTNFFRSLYNDDSLSLEPDFSSIPELKEDEEKRHTRIMQDIEHAIITPAEARELKGYDKSTNPELNKYYISSSLKPLGEEQTNI